MIPTQVEIKTVEMVDGKPEAISQFFYCAFNNNSANAFRAKYDMKFSKFEGLFLEFAKKPKDQNKDKLDEAAKNFVELTHFAFLEGARITKTEFTLSLEDLNLWMNDDPENTALMTRIYIGANPIQLKRMKKKIKKN